MEFQLSDILFLVGVALIVGFAVGVTIDSAFSFETVAICNETHCVDNYRIHCDEIEYDLPTGFSARIMQDNET